MLDNECLKNSALLTILVANSFISFAQSKKVALTSFWASKHIGFQELGVGIGLVKLFPH
jgi:hypothetical protein